MSPEDIAEELTTGPFVATGSQVGGEWLVVWTCEGAPAGQATFREIPGGGIVWTRFWGARRGQGLYTQALRFSAGHGGAQIDGRTDEKDFYLESGFTERYDGQLVATPKKAKAWLKGR